MDDRSDARAGLTPDIRGNLVADDDARALAAGLLRSGHGALATLLDARPMAMRVACLWIGGVGMTMLVSGLSDQSRALDQDPACALLLGGAGDERGDAGDPLGGPRLTLRGRAEPCDKAARRAEWQADRPRAAVCYDIADLRLVRLRLSEAILTAGFGRGVRLGPGDLPA